MTFLKILYFSSSVLYEKNGYVYLIGVYLKKNLDRACRSKLVVLSRTKENAYVRLHA